MSSRTTIADMRWLQQHLQEEREQTCDILGERDQVDRLIEWVETAIRVRVAQKTRSKTPQHDDMIGAYRAAVALWKSELEHETVMHPGDVATFVDRRPHPRLRDFMVASRKPFRFCPTCGTDLATPEQADAEDAAELQALYDAADRDAGLEP